MASPIVVALVAVTAGAIAFGLALATRPRAGAFGRDLLARTRAIGIVAGGLVVLGALGSIGRLFAPTIEPVLGPMSLLVAGALVAGGGAGLIGWTEAVVRTDRRFEAQGADDPHAIVRRTGQVAVVVGSLLAIGATVALVV